MGKYNSFRSKWELIILFFPLFLSFCVSAATAQVIIKEKIEIDGLAQNKVNNKSFCLNADSIESYLVMPKRGMLVARIWGIQHLDVPLPGYSTFNVHFIKGDSTKTDSLINSIPLSFDSLYGWLNFCGPPPVLNQMWYSYFSDPAYEFYLGGVNEGDTVQFIYRSDDVNNGEPIDYGYISAEPRGSGSWYMKIGSYDDCIWDYAIQLYESRNFQFEYDKNKSWPFNQEGWPIYGEPNGYGLMQLDKSSAATERQLWNWEANIDGAKYKFYTLIKSNNTDKFLDKHPDTVTEEMRLKSAYQKYNFFGWDKGKKSEHYYYMWDGKKWDIDKFIPLEKKLYGQDYVWEKYGDGVYKVYAGLNQ